MTIQRKPIKSIAEIKVGKHTTKDLKGYYCIVLQGSFPKIKSFPKEIIWQKTYHSVKCTNKRRARLLLYVD